VTVPLPCPVIRETAGTSGDQRSLTDNAHANGPRPIYLVGGRSLAVGVGFEPTVTRATTVFKIAT
jgi:hypothetical protein